MVQKTGHFPFERRFTRPDDQSPPPHLLAASPSVSVCLRQSRRLEIRLEADSGSKIGAW